MWRARLAHVASSSDSTRAKGREMGLPILRHNGEVKYAEQVAHFIASRAPVEVWRDAVCYPVPLQDLYWLNGTRLMGDGLTECRLWSATGKKVGWHNVEFHHLGEGAMRIMRRCRCGGGETSPRLLLVWRVCRCTSITRTGRLRRQAGSPLSSASSRRCIRC